MFTQSINLNAALDNDSVEFGWWVEILTVSPVCIYYFGAFDTEKTAELARGGYLEDLQEEGAEVIATHIKQCQPQKLTIFEEELRSIDFKLFPPAVIVAMSK